MNSNHGNPMKTVLNDLLKWIVGFVVSAAILGLCVCVYNNTTAPKAVEGQVFTGTAKGMMCDIVAEVTVADGRIVDVKLTGADETPSLGGVVLEEMPGKILEAQSADVDAMAGATVTADAVRAAVNSALEQAGLYVPTEETTEASAEEAAEAAASGPALAQIMASYTANKDNDYIVDYLETDPYLVSLYEGFGFAKQYGSARGHEYCLEDLKETARPHPLANCMTCKTSDFTELVQAQGVSAYSLDFNEIIDSMTENVGCYNCHADKAETGELVVTHDYIIDKLGSEMDTIDAATLSCGQCHIEYYFEPDTKATTVPYTSVAGMTPEAMLEYYDAIGFSDWTQPSTGTGLLKAQHPEMETYLNGSIHASMGMSCASCHMEKVTGEATYTSHTLVSPLDSPAILETCATCHKGVDMAEKVHTLQAEVTARETEVGNKLAAFKEALAEAVASGTWAEEDLNNIRTIHRHAQWFFDYQYVENSEGAHNSRLAYECLDKADALITEGMAALGSASETEAAQSFIPLSEAADGTYSATAKGFGGDITVDVTLTGGKITDVKAVGDSETAGLGSVAVEKLPGKLLAAQSLDVDAISGATVSSNAICKAFTDALAQANVDAAALTGTENQGEAARTAEVRDVDVVIVGAGGAGMSAAITAKQAGMNVLVLEKMPYVGGNTTKATGGMNAAETHYQKEQGIEDSVELFVSDTMKGGHEINNIDLVTTMAENSADAIEWLDELGAPLPKVSFSGGASVNRIHAPADGSGVGEYLVNAFSGILDQMGIEVLLETKAVSILMNDGAACGVMAEGADCDYTIHAKAVILATGGFGANEEMYCTYRPDLKGTVTTNAPGATGDGIVLAQSVGADLVDIEQIQLHPTVEQTTSIMVTESVRGDGAILVNQSGVRFTNELLTRDVVSAAELEQEGCYAYIIFDQRLREGLKATEKYIKNGIVTEAESIEALAEALGMDPAVLSQTLSDWNAAVAAGEDTAFGRTTGMEHDLSVAPYYAIKIAPGIHHTMGGVKIDTETHVINTDGEIIPGLFAAGEVCGGVHGGNRIGGNAVADIVVFGRIAGANATEYATAE